MNNTLSDSYYIEVLRGAIDVMENIGWTQNFLAMNKHGYPCNILSNEASCFCAIGAIAKYMEVEGTRNHKRFKRVEEIVNKIESNNRELLSDYSYSISKFNNCKTKEEVIELFNKEINRLSR